MAVSLSIQRVFLYQSQLHSECNVTTTIKLFDQELQSSCFHLPSCITLCHGVLYSAIMWQGEILLAN